MDASILEVAALGRSFTLGMLYDARKDQVIPGVTLWDDKTLEDMTEKENHQSSDFKISASDSLEERSSVMDVSASLKASFMGGLVKVGGSAKYLNDQKSSKHQCRVTLQYKATTVYKHLTMSPAEMKTHLRVDDDLMSMATHVVTAISYGVNAFFVFDSQKLDVSSKSKIEGSLQAAVSKGGFGMEAEVSVKQSKQERSLNEQFTCKFYGDVIPESNPTTFTEALKTYKHLPKLLGENNENSCPQKVWMMPLKKLLPSAAELVSELSPGMAIKVQDALEDFHNLKMRCNDCLEDSHSFPPIFERLTNFQNVSNCYSDKLKETYAKKLPAIRAGKEEEKELLKLFIDRENSPFSSEKLEKWMTNSERETSVIDSCVKAMKDAKIILKESELTAEVQDHEEDVLCFVFTSLDDTDPYVQKMTDYLNSLNVQEIEDVSPSTHGLWYMSNEVTRQMREKAREFGELATVLKNSKGFKFLVTAIRNDKFKGATIYHYRNGKQITEDFSKPRVPNVKKIEDRKTLIWYACDVNLDPETAHPNLKVTDNKTLEHEDKKQKDRSDNHKRFDEQFQIMCKEKLRGDHYWEVEVNTDEGIDIGVGVCYESLQRKGPRSKHNNIGFSPSSWSLGWKWKPELEFYMEHDNEYKTKSVPKTGFSRIGVFLRWEAGTLSYYIVKGDKLDHIHTFDDGFNDDVIPCMKMWKKNSYLSLCL